MKYRYVLLLLTVLIFATRLFHLGYFMTVDEPTWMLRSGEFYDKLVRQHDPTGTYVTTHPGATLNWLAGAGIFIREAQLGQGIDTSNINEFRVFALVPTVFATSFLLAVLCVYLMRLFGFRAGFISSLFLITDPYLFGLSQIVHADALLALSMTCSLLIFLFSFQAKRDRRLRELIFAGIFAGISLGTKMLPALWLFPVYVAILSWQYRASLRYMWRPVIRWFGFVFGVAMLTFVVLWPALWSQTNSLNEPITQDAVTVATDEHVALAVSEDAIEPASFYVRTLLGRVSPMVQLFVFIGLLWQVRLFVSKRSLSHTLWLFLYAFGFLVGITFIAKKSDRYALPAIIALLAAVGPVIIFIMEKMQRWSAHTFAQRVVPAGLLIILCVQLLLWRPYPISYNNPLFPTIRPLSQQGWGEGLDGAARWINSQPFDERLHIASWYPSVMDTYFQGRTFSLSSREDHRVGYVVTYRNMGGRANDTIASDVLDEFRGREPVHVVSIRGVPYVWIYNVLGPYYFRQHVGELSSGVEVGQTIPIVQSNWSRIDIGLATFGRENEGEITAHIRKNPSSTQDIRTISVPAAEILDQGWQAFSFEPIANSAGKEYYVAITSTGTQGNAATVRYSSENLMPGNAYIRDQERGGDLAYRLP